MYYKLFNEEGDYLDSNGNSVNLFGAESISVPNGTLEENGWFFFENEEAAINHYNITKKETVKDLGWQ